MSTISFSFMFVSATHKILFPNLRDNREDNNGRRQATFIFDNDKKKFDVFWTQTFRNLKSFKFANFFSWNNKSN